LLAAGRDWDLRNLMPPELGGPDERFAVRISPFDERLVSGYLILLHSTSDYRAYSYFEWGYHSWVTQCSMLDMLEQQAARLRETNHQLLAESANNQQAMVELAYNATHDALTGLPNRALLLSRLDLAMKRLARNEASRFALLYIDLDKFKPVNDEHGHLAGDHVLREVSARLNAAVRNTDTPARYGGDEFAVLLDDVKGAQEALEVATRIKCGIAEPIQWQAFELRIGCSIGVVIGEPGTANPEELIRCADNAMYKAKRRRITQPVLIRLREPDGE